MGLLGQWTRRHVRGMLDARKKRAVLRWSPQQSAALTKAGEWMRDPSSQVFYVAGFAGTGKTTLAKHLVSGARRRWMFAAFTGKAAHVLRTKGCAGATTIHSLIYRPAGMTREAEIRDLETRRDSLVDQLACRENLSDEEVRLLKTKLELTLDQLRTLSDSRRARFEVWPCSPLSEPEIEGVVIDEVSMVDERLARDLESFGKKILVLGDPAQLPPVGAGGYYTNRAPDVMLTDVHRQAKESGILALATLVREGGRVGDWQSTDDCQVLFRADWSREELAPIATRADQTIVGRNFTRKATNARYRELLGRASPHPETGDRLICLRNDHKLGLFNGSQWIVDESAVDEESCTVSMRITSDETRGLRLQVDSWLHHFLGREQELKSSGFDRREMSEFDFSYAVTCHKAQGSQWESVFLLDESGGFGDSRRWLYTGITRASRKLVVLT